MIGGSWEPLVAQSSTGDSGSLFPLDLIVALHVATATALLLLVRTKDDDARLTWLVVSAIPVG